jgi:hypothetical protein
LQWQASNRAKPRLVNRQHDDQRFEYFLDVVERQQQRSQYHANDHAVDAVLRPELKQHNRDKPTFYYSLTGGNLPNRLVKTGLFEPMISIRTPGLSGRHCWLRPS